MVCACRHGVLACRLNALHRLSTRSRSHSSLHVSGYVSGYHIAAGLCERLRGDGSQSGTHHPRGHAIRRSVMRCTWHETFAIWARMPKGAREAVRLFQRGACAPTGTLWDGSPSIRATWRRRSHCHRSSRPVLLLPPPPPIAPPFTSSVPPVPSAPFAPSSLTSKHWEWSVGSSPAHAIPPSAASCHLCVPRLTRCSQRRLPAWWPSRK